MATSIARLGLLLACLHLTKQAHASFVRSSSSSNAPHPPIVDADTDKCTTIIVGRTAGTEGPMNTHTADCSDCDFRLNKVPAMDWREGETRPLYEYKGSYPATVTRTRGDTWHPRNLQGSESQLAMWGEESVITGTVPQIAHTYALIEAGYGIMNEHGVAIGESTCAARFTSKPTSAGGQAQIEAVIMMGEMAEKYGFYGADWSGGDASLGEAGEALTVIDKTEAWIFHVLADDSGTSAIWAAQRVPDNHISVVANMFVIKEVHRSDPSTFLYSRNMFAIAAAHSLIPSEDAPLNFNLVFGLPRAHSAYCTRRVWRIFSLANPAIALPPDTDMWASDYPFSVPVASALGPEDLMRLQRDHYEGSAYDLTKGLAAGPFGDPQRFDPSTAENNMTALELIQGGFERAVSLFRTSYSFVAVSRTPSSVLPAIVAPKLWIAVYAPHASSYIPLYPHQSSLPTAYTTGSLFRYDPEVAFWNFLAANNYASRLYKFAMQDVFDLQRRLQAFSVLKSRQLETQLADMMNGTPADVALNQAAVGLLDSFSRNQANGIVGGWSELLPRLITKYHDGYRAENLDEPSISMHKLFYPKWWLEAVGFFNNKPNAGPDVILFQPLATQGKGFVPLILLTALCSLAVGYAIGKADRRWMYTNL